VLKTSLLKRALNSMNNPSQAFISATLVIITLLCSGCAVVAVADAVVTAGATVVKTGVKVTGAVVDAVIPDAKPAKK
jgi:ribosomal protein L10